jgi:5-azacytidine-induced protein 1
VFATVKQKMADLRLQLNAKTQRVHELDAELRVLRQQSADKDAAHARSLESKLDAQKRELEASLRRQLGFVQTLVADKEKLTADNRALAARLESTAAAGAAREEELRREFREQLSRVKEQWSAAEKARRERWVSEQTENIKKLTVKGLEPELARILEKSKGEVEAERERGREVRRASYSHTEVQHLPIFYNFCFFFTVACPPARGVAVRVRSGARLAAASGGGQRRARARGRARRGVRRLSQACKVLIAIFFNSLFFFTHSASRLEQLRREHEQALSAQRSRLAQEHAAELASVREGLSARVSALEEQLASQRERERGKVAEAIEACRRQHEGAVRLLDEQDRVEKERWQAMVLKKLQNELAEKEAGLRSELAAVRERELETVAARLQEERRALQARVVEQYEAQLQEAVRLRRADAERLGRAAEELEGKVEAAQALAEERMRKLEQSERKLARYEEELLSLRQSAGSAAGDAEGLRRRVAALEELLEARVAEVKAECSVAQDRAVALAVNECDSTWRAKVHEEVLGEREKARQEADSVKTKEMEELHQRVGVMLQRKEEIIGKYKERVVQLDEEVRSLKFDMERQKHELLAQLDE